MSNKLFPEYKQPDYAQIAADVLLWWKENQVFEATLSKESPAGSFVFYEGPPSANGTPGIHHVMARSIKDIFCRYKTMTGYRVERKGGWDTHGLPVELQVEKELGITKEDIGKKISIKAYNENCRETVMRYKLQWDDLTQKMGYWVDLNNPYITFENDYIEACWFLLKALYEKGLLYKGYTIQPYSPAAGTGLSSHELNQPGCYKNVKDTSIVAQFKVIRNALSEKLFANLGTSTKPFSHRELLKSINDPDVTDTSTQIIWQDIYLLAWTTTPWTLPSNAALAVGENITYVKVKTFNPYTYQPIVVILAKDLVQKYFHPKTAEIPLESYNPGDKVIPYQILERYQGSELIGISYQQLMPATPGCGLLAESEWRSKSAFRVIPGDFVSTEDGTGIVHIAPTFGADDARVAKLAGIPAITVTDSQGKELPLVDKKGKFVDQVPHYGGKFVKNYDNQDESDPNYKSVDILISIQLKTENKAFKVEKYEHSYPHCWRTDKPVLYYPLESWFIKTTALKDRMVELNKSIQWKPESTGTGRFGNWLENLVDWNLSRSRYWGTPLPIWVSEDEKEQKCIGSIAELKAEIQKAIKVGITTYNPFEGNEKLDLHRPYVDEIVLVDSRGKKMFRQPDLIDVWFDSGAMPYAQWGLKKDIDLEKTKNEAGLLACFDIPIQKNTHQLAFPADFISEGVDQTRGWFFTLHAISTLLFDSISFKNVVSTGLVLDKNGEKMSKRKGNVINPFDTLSTYGPDATRWYMIANANPWDNLKFDLEGVTEVQRKLFGTLQNTYNFFALYANLDRYIPTAQLTAEHMTEADKWIVSKLHTLTEQVKENYDQYEPTKVARLITDFVCDDLSNWYVRLNRKRFWKGELNDDKKSAYNVLYTCLATLNKLMAPITPFYSEFLHRSLHSQAQSIHLENFPISVARFINKDLERRMQLAQQVTTLVHSIRKNKNLRVRLPLQKIWIPVLESKTKDDLLAVSDLILSEVNVKEMAFIENTYGIVVKKAKPNFQTLGKSFGKYLKEIGAAIANFSQEEIAKIESGETLYIQTTGLKIPITLSDVLISAEDIPGWSVASDNHITVALDIQVTHALKKEGLARDFVNRIQNYRKENGFDVTDKIKIQIQKSEAWIDEALLQHKGYICTETQAKSLDLFSEIVNPVVIDMEDFVLNTLIER